MSNVDNAEIPQWKKELIARLRSQNKRTATAGGRQLRSGPPHRVQQPEALSPRESGAERCNAVAMVQERTWDRSVETADSEDSSEELRYGPGIVNKLRNKYLSLAQRESAKRASILPLRKAASLENILDDLPAPAAQPRLNGSGDGKKNAVNRYRNAARGSDLKRARSVEAISRAEEREEAKPKREDVLIKEGSDKPAKISDNGEKAYSHRINRPKRIAPVMNEREKPPVDVVKQAKLIFERRPEQRTKPPQQTGEVAARIASYKSIIGKAKKPPIKSKPVIGDKPKTNGVLRKIEPIPDVSRSVSENSPKISTSLSETPDLIMTSSPLPSVNSPSFRISATENFIKEERRLADVTDDAGANTMTFNFAKTPNKNVLNTQSSPLQPLKLEINGVPETSALLATPKPNLTNLEIEKNLINAAKTLEQPKSSIIATSVDGVTKIKVPKVKKPPRELENNSIVFKFTDRKDVPNYVHNDGITRVAKIEKPKVGEGGIIILPGASIDESFTDEDEEIMRSLEGPPSPCDVTFINDNILIDGKSSLSQKLKKAKMKISFVEAGPEVYEYPSESSLLIEDVPTSPLSAQMRPSVPSVTGSSSLGNYTPKSTEEFQPGVTRSVQNIPKTENNESNDLILQEVEKPVLFSAGANSDILF